VRFSVRRWRSAYPEQVWGPALRGGFCDLSVAELRCVAPPEAASEVVSAFVPASLEPLDEEAAAWLTEFLLTGRRPPWPDGALA
jgi:hypothetical protein